MTYKKKSGVPKGFTHDWTYRGHWHEKKIAPKKWKFRFRATKGRKASRFGSFGKGTTGRWAIRGIQSVIKTGVGQYQTDFRGTKTSLGFKVKKPRRDRKY